MTSNETCLNTSPTTHKNASNVAKHSQLSENMKETHTCDIDYKLEYLPRLLREQELEIFFQLLWKTINSILTCKNDKKRQFVQLTKIEEKLNKRACILLFHLLTNYHFNLSHDGTKLIFNQTQLCQLQKINNVLLTQNIYYQTVDKKLKNIQNIIMQQRKIFVSKDSIQNHNITEHKCSEIKQKFFCICGEQLIKIHDISTLYDGHNGYSHLICDECEGVSKVDDIFWHCSKRYNEIHMTGFDICNNCIHKYSQKALNKVSDDFKTESDMLIQLSQKSETKNETKITLCTDNVSHCRHVKTLMEVITKYTSNTNNSYFDAIYSKILQVANAFNHVLQQHENDNDFCLIYECFLKECNLNQCQIIERNRQNRNKYQTKSYDSCYNNKIDKLSHEMVIIQELLDTIHCHYLHSHHMGYRLTVNEQNSLCDNRNDSNTHHHTQRNSNDKLTKLYQIIKNKRNHFNKTLQATIDPLGNSKFMSHLGKSSNHNKQENKNMDQYSYGFQMFYWDYYKNINDLNPLMYYVPSKYLNLKEELTTNSISRINVDRFIIESKRAIIYKSTEYARGIHANVDDLYHGSVYSKPCHYGYNEFFGLSSNHLICMIIYCNYDEFQKQFSSTLRKQTDIETMANLIKRNSNFHFFTKFLMETINVFGTFSANGNIQSFYHGINKNMLFKSTAAYIYGPLSTTSSFCVAINFANNNNGLILELNPFQSLKYFSCSWLSVYSNESEFFFIGGLETFTFINILNTTLGCEYRQFVKVISIIDTLANGHWFKTNIESSSHLTPIDKQMAVKLIKHELKIEQYENLTEYVANLFHHICINKNAIIINFKVMNIETFDTCTQGVCMGHLFLKHIFCSSTYESINFNLINKLYPNLRWIQLFNLSFINSLTLNDILNFLCNNLHATVHAISLVLMEQVSSFILSAMDETVSFYTPKFKAIKWSIQHKYCEGKHAIAMMKY